jgi:hypothetical protein
MGILKVDYMGVDWIQLVIIVSSSIVNEVMNLEPR